jgi:hypothetical protein
MNNNYFTGIGRRKEATARVYLKEGGGKNEIRTSQKGVVVSRVQAKINELEKSLHSLNLALADKKAKNETTDKALSLLVKHEKESELIELKERLKKEKGRKWKRIEQQKHH